MLASPVSPGLSARRWPDPVAGAFARSQARPACRTAAASRSGRWYSVESPGRQLGLEERPQPVDHLIRRQAAEPLSVEPLEALPVEDRTGLLDVRDVEALDQDLEREDLLLGARRPAQERQVVN